MARRTLALAFAALLPLAAAVPAGAQGPATPAARVDVAGDAVVFQGRIDAPAVQRFLEALREPGIRRLVITSRGGQVSSALDMGEAVLAHGLDVEVPLACLSSCANYVFPAGRHKRLGHPRAVGWHGDMAHVLYLEQSGSGQWSPDEIEGARQLAARESDFFRRIGVDGFVCWFAKIAPYDVEDFYTLAPGDMARFGIRDVEVLPGEPPPDGGDTPQLVSVDVERLERDRAAIPFAR